MAKKRRKKYKRPYPNNPRKRDMVQKIPFNRSVSRKVAIEFKNVCDELGVGMSPMTEELLKDFILKIRNSK